MYIKISATLSVFAFGLALGIIYGGDIRWYFERRQLHAQRQTVYSA